MIFFFLMSCEWIRDGSLRGVGEAGKRGRDSSVSEGEGESVSLSGRSWPFSGESERERERKAWRTTMTKAAISECWI